MWDQDQDLLPWTSAVSYWHHESGDASVIPPCVFQNCSESPRIYANAACLSVAVFIQPPPQTACIARSTTALATFKTCQAVLLPVESARQADWRTFESIGKPDCRNG